MPTSSVNLRAHNGQFVCAELDGTVVANRDVAGAWETFTVVTVFPGTVALRTAHGRYLCAEGGGGGAVVADREQIGSWETFQIVPIMGGIALRTCDNTHYLCAEGGGGGPVVANRTQIGPWEVFNGPVSTPPPGPVEPGQWIGPITAGNRTFLTGGQTYRPVGLSAFTLPKLFAEGKRPEAEAYVHWAVSRGFNFFRLFLAGKGWNELSPDRARAVLPELLAWLKSLGCGAEATLITGSKLFAEDGFTNWGPFVRDCGEIARVAENAIIEVANEYYHGSQSDAVHDPENLRKWGRSVPAPVPWAIGAARTDEPGLDKKYAGRGGTYCTAHLDRSRDFWNQVRRIREIYAIFECERVPSVDNERIGAAEQNQGGRRQSDPVFFLTAGVLDRCFDTPSIHHQESGLLCTVPGPNEAACADAYVRGLTRVVPFTTGLAYRNSGHVGSPVDSFENATRAYSFVAGDEGVTTVLGASDRTRIKWGNGYAPSETLVRERARDGSELIVYRVRR